MYLWPSEGRKRADKVDTYSVEPSIVWKENLVKWYRMTLYFGALTGSALASLVADIGMKAWPDIPCGHKLLRSFSARVGKAVNRIKDLSTQQCRNEKKWCPGGTTKTTKDVAKTDTFHTS